MSLSAIRRVREAGGKPAMVKVAIGRAPDWLGDGPDVVRVSERGALAALDWLPLVGVWVTVHWLSGTAERAQAVLSALDRTGARLFGAASSGGVIALAANADDRDAALIRKEWELLCQA